MIISKQSCKFSLFGKKVYMFHEKSMGIVIEKEQQVICVYGTDEDNRSIYCAIPLCHPKYLKGMEFAVSFFKDGIASVAVGDIRIIVDFNIQKCGNNKNLQNYGSDTWGQNVTEAWSESFSAFFEN